jgi:hypothetical protein
MESGGGGKLSSEETMEMAPSGGTSSPTAGEALRMLFFVVDERVGTTGTDGTWRGTISNSSPPVAE